MRLGLTDAAQAGWETPGIGGVSEHPLLSTLKIFCFHITEGWLGNFKRRNAFFLFLCFRNIRIKFIIKLLFKWNKFSTLSFSYQNIISSKTFKIKRKHQQGFPGIFFFFWSPIIFLKVHFNIPVHINSHIKIFKVSRNWYWFSKEKLFQINHFTESKQTMKF